MNDHELDKWKNTENQSFLSAQNFLADVYIIKMQDGEITKEMKIIYYMYREVNKGKLVRKYFEPLIKINLKLYYYLKYVLTQLYFHFRQT